MFSDPDFQVSAPVDKRGRKVASKAVKGEDMRRYYRLKDEGEWGGEGAGAAARKLPEKGGEGEQQEEEEEEKSSGGSEEEEGVASSGSEGEEEEAEAKLRWARARGLVGELSFCFAARF